jgi:hypothetical protein
MAYDPNPNDNRPDLRTPTETRGSSSWMGWVAVLAVIVVGAFVWSQMGGSSTDPTTTSSTTPPAAEQTAPAPAAPAPATPAPAPATPAPAAPATGGSNGSQP